MDMDDLDKKLALLATAPLPPALNDLEDRVLARLQSLSVARAPSFAAAAIFAMVLGVSVGGFASRGDPLRPELAAVQGQSEYALSVLLGV